jgi:glycosyltransferase involved in cell wall biosynthesis
LARWFAPVVLTIHDPVPHAGRDEAARADWPQRLRIRRRAALCLAHGDHCLEVLRTEDAGAISGAGTIRHGVVLQPVPEDRRAPEPRSLLMFGRMEAYKGLEVLIAACERLHDQGTPFALTLAGRGPEVERLRSRIDALSEVRVLDGWLTPREAISAFQRASLVVMPYLESTQSGVLAAAFANGRPVVASRVGGLPDVVRDGETGVLVPPGDPGALAQAIAALLDDPAAQTRMGGAALRYAEDRLAWGSIAAETAAFYRTVART